MPGHHQLRCGREYLRVIVSVCGYSGRLANGANRFSNQADGFQKTPLANDKISVGPQAQHLILRQ